jgi:hypothetical protein
MTINRCSGRQPTRASGPRVLAKSFVLCVFALTARAQQKPCCTITAVDARSAVASARVNATAQLFQFKVTPALATSLRPGQGVYANFSSRQVSLDGKTVCCTIIAVSPSPAVPAPAGRPSTPAPATQGQRSAVAQAASSTGSGSGRGPGSFHLPTPSSLTFVPDTLTGGVKSSATVTLTGAAPQNGLQISLSSNQPSVVPVPQKIEIPGGSTSANFSLPTEAVPLKSATDEPIPVTISASSAPSQLATTTQLVTQTGTIYVLPPIVKLLGSFTGQGSVVMPKGCAATPFSHTGGNSLDGCVLLNGPAADESQIKPALGGQSTPSIDIGAPHDRGARVSVSSSNPQIASVPATTVVPVGKDEGSFHIVTVPVQTATTVTISAHRTNSDTKSVQLAVLPPVLEDFTCTSPSVTGGKETEDIFVCTLTLTGPAYNGVVATLQFSGAQGLGNVTTSVPFQQGQASAPYQIPTVPVATDTTFSVIAAFGGVSKSLALTVNAPRPKDVNIPTPDSVTGGQPFSGNTVTLNALAPASGMYVYLKSSEPTVATVPGTVHVGGNTKTSDQFTIQTKPVSGQQIPNICASYDAAFTPPTPCSSLYVHAPSEGTLAIQSYVFTVNGQAVAVNDLQPGQAFSMCPIIKNVGQAASSSTTLNVTLSKSDGSTVQTWSPTVPGLNPNTTTGTSDVCIDVPALSSGYTYDFNGSFGSAGWFFMIQLSF